GGSALLLRLSARGRELRRARPIACPPGRREGPVKSGGGRGSPASRSPPSTQEWHRISSTPPHAAAGPSLPVHFFHPALEPPPPPRLYAGLCSPVRCAPSHPP